MISLINLCSWRLSKRKVRRWNVFGSCFECAGWIIAAAKDRQLSNKPVWPSRLYVKATKMFMIKKIVYGGKSYLKMGLLVKNSSSFAFQLQMLSNDCLIVIYKCYRKTRNFLYWNWGFLFQNITIMDRVHRKKANMHTIWVDFHNFQKHGIR